MDLDDFIADNEWLVVAEIELEHGNQAFDRPDWVGPEVTHDVRYRNSRLVDEPFRLCKTR